MLSSTAPRRVEGLPINKCKKKRLRAVVCGNFLPREPSSEDSTYATGVEAVSVRAALAIASRRLWRPTALDIRTAFAPVRVPNKTTIIVKPPRILIDLQLVPEEERWIVDRALYGLTSSPRDWSVYRDQTLQSLPIPSVLGTLRLEQCKSDDNLCKLVCPKWVIQGVVVIYVDDIMCLASVPQAQELWEATRATWKTNDPSWASEQEPCPSAAWKSIGIRSTFGFSRLTILLTSGVVMRCRNMPALPCLHGIHRRLQQK